MQKNPCYIPERKKHEAAALPLMQPFHASSDMIVPIHLYKYVMTQPPIRSLSGRLIAIIKLIQLQQINEYLPYQLS